MARTEQVAVGGTALHLLTGGTGNPCLVLHGFEGDEGWLAFHTALAERRQVYAPSHPGFGRTACPEWIRTVAHQAIFYDWFLQSADLRAVDLVGIGLGGWIAAHMAVLSSTRLRNLILVNAVGVQPTQGEILDIFVAPWREVIDQAFADPAHAPEYARIYGSGIADFGGQREAGRTMTMRMCFRPYMYDPSLPGMLGKINVPTLVVGGRQDRVVPPACATQFQQAIPGARLRLLDNCGHFAHLDQPLQLAATISEFVTR